MQNAMNIMNKRDRSILVHTRSLLWCCVFSR